MLLFLIYLTTFAYGLKLNQSPQTPTNIFTSLCVTKSLPWILHSMKFGDGKVIRQLLGHSRLPFQQFYSTNCAVRMRKGSLREIINSIKSNPELRKYIMPPECLSQLDMSQMTVLSESIGIDHFLADISSTFAVTIGSRFLPNTVFELTKKPDPRFQFKLLPYCSWITDEQSTDVLVRKPLRSRLSDTEGWSIIHHSCFIVQSESVLFRNYRRWIDIMLWLMQEINMKQVENGGYSSGTLTRYTVHTLLIIKQIRNTVDFSRSVLSPELSSHLRALQRCGRKISPIFSNLILSATGAIKSPCYVLKAKGAQLYLPPIESILHATLEDINLSDKEARSRWILAVIELYYYLNGSGAKIFQNETIRNLVLESFKEAPSLVKAHWIELYIAEFDSVNFLFLSVCDYLGQDKSLQTKFLQTIQAKDLGPRLKTALNCIPSNRLLYESRLRFLIDGHILLILKRSVMFVYGNVTTKNMKELPRLVHIFFEKMRPTMKPSYRPDNSIVYKPALYTKKTMEVFSFVMAVIQLFEIMPPYSISPETTRILLSWNTDDFDYESVSRGFWAVENNFRLLDIKYFPRLSEFDTKELSLRFKHASQILKSTLGPFFKPRQNLTI